MQAVGGVCFSYTRICSGGGLASQFGTERAKLREKQREVMTVCIQLGAANPRELITGRTEQGAREAPSSPDVYYTCCEVLCVCVCVAGNTLRRLAGVEGTGEMETECDAIFYFLFLLSLRFVFVFTYWFFVLA